MKLKRGKYFNVMKICFQFFIHFKSSYTSLRSNKKNVGELHGNSYLYYVSFLLILSFHYFNDEYRTI